MKNDYYDLLHKEHHVSQNHPRLSREQRAAQFMPFAALTGFSDAIEETAVDRLKTELDSEKGRMEEFESGMEYP